MTASTSLATSSSTSPNLGAKAAEFKEAFRHKLIDHKPYIRKNGEDMPEVRDWKWGD